MSIRILVVTIAVIFVVAITVVIGTRAGAVGALQAVGILIVTLTVAIITIGRAIGHAYRRKARQAGYGTIGAYLRAVPRTDEEKRDAVDLALKGLVTCLVGLLLPPLLLIGAVPLYYGARKVLHASMGLGLVDDAEPPRA